ncbi:hypothetical protein JCM16816_21500 [Thermoanaerobacter brockii subsp. lactiethylicus]|jgi:hypothetical protein|uniref:hypothetical protein n=1 Tax=Thermoanaerobacter sp. TaxID=1755 RepID=UPI00346417B7
MNKKTFVPELHDIGKLVDKDAIKSVNRISLKDHVFINFDFTKLGINQPTSPSWWGQYHHFKDIINTDINTWSIKDINGNIPSIEDKYHLFLLILADHLASSVSRAVDFKGGPGPNEDGILKLWNENYYNSQRNKGKYWAAFKTLDELKILFDVIQNCQSGEEFLGKYKEYLLLTPEDRSIPKNVTSLYTHIELVGKIYRVFEKNTKVVKKSNGEIAIEYEGKEVQTVKEAEGGNRTKGSGDEIAKGKWQAKLLKCWIKFPHSFVRLQDVNLLKQRDELINCTKNKYKDEVLLATSDFILLFLPANGDAKQIFEPFLEWNFYVEVEEILADLGILNSILDSKILKIREQNQQPQLSILNNRGTKIRKIYFFPELSDEIKPPICEVCQQRRGVEREKGRIKEWICDKCSEIRNMGEPFREYGTIWEEENVKVCWFKFSLNQKKLEEWLRDKFEKYIDDHSSKLGQPNTLKEEFRPIALQIDFNNDYKEMLKRFWDEVSSEEFRETIKKPIKEYDELGVFKYSPELAKIIIEKFINLFELYFPDCISNESSPISLSLSVANIKYPVREHWRFFEDDKKSFLNVMYYQVFSDKYTKDELKNIIDKVINTKISSSFLHKLLQIEKNFYSDMYMSVEIFNNRKKYPDIYELLLKDIRPSKFLNLYKLLGREEI